MYLAMDKEMYGGAAGSPAILIGKDDHCVYKNFEYERRI
ncbi:hypothetical protein JOC33_003892 [Thalassobacillus pellis]|nr:hypothetical protein [Thalassobacillus pellis]